MSTQLLTIAIGPVQDFIAAARRTRDLWFGSHVLSEISKAAARALQDAGTELIFPAPDSASDLEPKSSLNVANKILAVVPESLDAQILSDKAREAAQNRWLKFAEEARGMAREAVRDEIWKDQIHDVIEFYSAWVPLNGNYKACRERVERLLAGRKALRDFFPAKGRAGIPKSSLDGARESVLVDPKKLGRAARAKARLKDNEQLDAVGLVKRLADKPETQLVSVSRIAADPWVRHVAGSLGGKVKLDQIANLCHHDFASTISDPTFEAFQKEGTVLYPSRLDTLIKDGDMEEHREAKLKPIKNALAQIMEQGNGGLGFGEPSPYLAILVADGDRMGAALSRIAAENEHKKFSNQLSQFAGEAKRIFAKNHGCLVYSGGDDVLGFLPLNTCLKAARELHEKFGALMNGFKTGEHEKSPTLSVGIAIGHCMEALEDLLEMGRVAERAAKAGQKADPSDDRNGLAVHVTTRGADATTVRAQWTDEPDKKLEQWIGLLLSDQIPDKLAYELRQMASEYSGWDGVSAELLQADVQRLLKKKRSGGEKLSEETTRLLFDSLETPEDLLRRASELIIAKHLSEGMKYSRNHGNIAVEKNT